MWKTTSKRASETSQHHRLFCLVTRVPSQVTELRCIEKSVAVYGVTVKTISRLNRVISTVMQPRQHTMRAACDRPLTAAPLLSLWSAEALNYASRPASI